MKYCKKKGINLQTGEIYYRKYNTKQDDDGKTLFLSLIFTQVLRKSEPRDRQRK